jgi:hypothetical protein
MDRQTSGVQSLVFALVIVFLMALGVVQVFDWLGVWSGLHDWWCE